MKWAGVLLKIAKGVAKAVTLGLIGRGRKTQQAGELAGQVLENLEKEKEVK